MYSKSEFPRYCYLYFSDSGIWQPTQPSWGHPVLAPLFPPSPPYKQCIITMYNVSAIHPPIVSACTAQPICPMSITRCSTWWVLDATTVHHHWPPCEVNEGEIGTAARQGQVTWDKSNARATQSEQIFSWFVFHKVCEVWTQTNLGNIRNRTKYIFEILILQCFEEAQRAQGNHIWPRQGVAL